MSNDDIGGVDPRDPYANSTVTIEIPIKSPLKSTQKTELVNMITRNFQKQIDYVTLRDSYYVEKRSAESSDTFNIAFEVLNPSTSFTKAIITLTKFVLEINRKNIITITKKNGKRIQLHEGMSEEEIKKSME